ncbi:MAG: cobalamin-dependent protein [Methanomassiliicoccales archaeon]|nr:cobalamin-dependent protein [Methanomassiliicoccales archaeon]
MELEDALISVDEARAERVVNKALQTMTPLECAEKVISPALRDIGNGWQEGTIALSQIYMGGRICEKILDKYLPLARQIRKTQPRLAIANLEDHHDLGQKIVYSVVRAGGFDIMNYKRQDAKGLAEMASKDKVDVLFVSTLMLRAALKVKELRQQLTSKGSNVKIVVGGAPFVFDHAL